MLRRRQAPTQDAIPEALPAPTSVFGEGSLISEFLSATQYDDGTLRVPGSIRIENMGKSYRVTVYDHDAGLRLAVSAVCVDEALNDIEVLLGAADAPWEVDRYLSEQVAKRGKKKKK